MKFDPRFIELLTKYEDFSANPYADKAASGKPTIGYGTRFYPNGKEVTLKDTAITKEQGVLYLTTALNTMEPKLLKIFTNWQKFPEQTKYAIYNMAYRGGVNNFTTRSPKFTKTLNDAYADGILSSDEYKNIAKEMDFSFKGNLGDRVQRNLALIGDIYNWDDNASINSLGGKGATSTPYTNFNNNVFVNNHSLNKKWLDRWEPKKENKKQKEIKNEEDLPNIFKRAWNKMMNYLDIIK